MVQTILVTGSNGLFGMAIPSMINEFTNYKFVFIDHSQYELTDKNQVNKMFEKYKPEIVIHLAAKVGGIFTNIENNIDFFVENNLINTFVLYTAYKCESVKKVLSCMSTCIFPDRIDLPLTVDKLHYGLPHSSNIGYSYAKRMIDIENRIFSNEEKQFFGIIPCNLYGKNDNFNLKTSHVIPAIIHKCYIAKKTNSDLIIEGSGLAKRQFLYSMDAAKLVLLLIQTDNIDKAEGIILAPKEEYTISEIVNKIVQIFNFTGKIIYNKTKDDGQLIKTADSTRIQNLFPDFKYTKIDDGLFETINWFVENFEKSRK